MWCARRLPILSVVLALGLSACGGGGESRGVVPPAPAPAPTGGRFVVGGFPASFTEFPVPAGFSPGDITIGPDGAAWFGVSSSTKKFGQITGTGAITLFMLPAIPSVLPGTTSQLASVDGAIASDAGSLFGVAVDPQREDESHLVRLTPPGGTVVEIRDLGTTNGVQKIIKGPDGNVWIAACVVGSCGQFSALLVGVTPAGSPVAGVVLGSFQTPYVDESIAARPDGNLYVTADFARFAGAMVPDSLVFQVSTSGVILHQFALANGSAPKGIVTGPDKNLWIAETGTNKIARMDTAGNFVEFSIPTANAGPQMITAGSDGALWFTEDSGNALGRITTAGAITEFPIPTPNSHPFGIASCPSACENAHGRIWFAERVGKIGKFEF